MSVHGSSSQTTPALIVGAGQTDPLATSRDEDVLTGQLQIHGVSLNVTHTPYVQRSLDRNTG